MPQLNRSIIERLVADVEKPGRYIGMELNRIIKHDPVLRIAVSFPDLYEVGMANNGIRILYDIANANPAVACERVYAVAADFERKLRSSGIPLYTLETYTPLNDLDMIGFNIPTELLYTNMLQVLDLGKVPLSRDKRGEGDPIVMAGGEAVSNPFPASDFIDLFFIGDGEAGIADICSILAKARAAGAGRAEKINMLAGIEGVLVPSRYSFSYNGPLVSGVEGPAVRRWVYRGVHPLDPLSPVVPNIRISQDRTVVEVARGCPNICNFCHAGFYELPYRRYDHRILAERIITAVKNTGFEDLTLSSLSIGDYPNLTTLLNTIMPVLHDRGTTVSLPSLRVDAKTLPVIENISDIRKTSLTFAVESASDYVRARANKRIVLDDLRAIVKSVYSKGWNLVKLYFMLGLPGCDTVDEASAVIELLEGLHLLGGRRKEINVTLSPFVPKPHTPFQWEREMDTQYFLDTIHRIRRGVPGKIKIKNHDLNASLLEGVFARGDARLGRVILASYNDGCRFDSWQEHFRFDVWRRNLDDLFPGWEGLLGERGDCDVLPWSVIITGFEKLIAARRKRSFDENNTSCASPEYAEPLDIEGFRNSARHFERKYVVKHIARVRVTKRGLLKLISHIDFMEVIKRGLRMADVPVSYSQGFNKRERMSAGYPVPLFVESDAELIDIDLYEDFDAESFRRVSARLPEGIDVVDSHYIEKRESIMALTVLVEYIVSGLSPGAAAAIRERLQARGDFTKKSKEGDGARILEFGKVINDYKSLDNDGFMFRLFTQGSMRIDSVLLDLAGASLQTLENIVILKTCQLKQDGESFVELL